MYTVLYVDDEQPLLDMAKIFLERSPEFSVITQTSARAALDSLLIAACDVIVSDYQMPEMDGLTFLKAVRERSKTLPFILFTSRGREEVVIEAINNGADFYLQKGGDLRSQFAELGHKIKKAVERKWAVDEHLKSENRLSMIFPASPIHQLITEFSTCRIVDINNRFLKDLKISHGDVIGKTMEEIDLFIDQQRAPGERGAVPADLR